MHPETIKSSPIELCPSWNQDDKKITMTLSKILGSGLRKGKCPQDNGTKGDEHQISVTFPGFEKVATCLRYTGAERFDNFEDVPAGNPLVSWSAVMRTWPEN